jgi:sirohydrochlorin cobaltochelatase
MKRKALLLILAWIVLLTPVAPVEAGQKKTGILLVAFGTTVQRAQAAYDRIDSRMRSAFPDIPIRWAFTSATVRKRLAREGRSLDSPELAIAKMHDEGFTHAAVQSLHIIAGEEFHELCRTADGFRQMRGFERIMIGAPLLGDQKDMEKVMAAVQSIGPRERKKDEAVVFMGHGSSHPANAAYTALMFQIQRKDPLVFVGCVDGYPGVNEIRDMLLEKKPAMVYLMPLMAVAGDHAHRDMAGDHEDSWKNILTRAGFQCTPLFTGMAEHDPFIDIWVDHLRAALNKTTLEKN